MTETQQPLGRDLGPWQRRGRMVLSRLSDLASKTCDESLRLVLWWGLLMVSTICLLEICRWFWLIYPETVVGKKFIAGTDQVPAFARLVLQEPHWHTALYVVTVPCIASLILAFGSRFCYLKRLFYNPFGEILRTFVWMTPVAIWTGYYVTGYLDLSLEAAIICATGPSLAMIPQAFRVADRLSPELGDCIRWLLRGVRQLRQRSNSSKHLRSDRFHSEHAPLS